MDHFSVGQLYESLQRSAVQVIAAYVSCTGHCSVGQLYRSLQYRSVIQVIAV